MLEEFFEKHRFRIGVLLIILYTILVLFILKPKLLG